MPLNKSKGNMYSWITHTWNTVKGSCPHNCSYCYMKQWGKQRPVHFDQEEMKTNLGEGNYIFVGSSCDMFAVNIPGEWILETIRHCYKFDNRYLFQSKNPGGFLAISKAGYGMKATICTTIETNRWYPAIMRYSPKIEDRVEGMIALKPFDRLVTIEPILDFDMELMIESIKRCEPRQVNIGADSGRNGLPEPHVDKVIELAERLREFTIVAKKRNLERLIKE